MMRRVILASVFLWAGVGLAACDSDSATTSGSCPATPCGADEVCDDGACVAAPTTCPDGYVRVAAGTFTMGSPATEEWREDSEVAHDVTITRAFCLKATEVTQAEFEAIAGYNNSSASDCGATCPVEKVRWMEATRYCNLLSQRDGLPECYTCTGTIEDYSLVCTANGDPYACLGYRLPTEAEWEYAARAGTTTPIPTGDLGVVGFCDATGLDGYGWYCGNSPSSPQPVAQKPANAWGLYDMAGNVYEWCHDDLGDYPTAAVTDPVGAATGERALRGGAYDTNPETCRSAARYRSEPGYAVHDQGFRPVRGVR
ncbi:MAG: formylglycine-generating enzyme family protein [Deltaproteobacteria bacterium]|nr:MAG: formylglycine-generating enzyme family protein [Deltaproteobacteria bacterium]